VTGTRAKSIDVEISDNGDGMNESTIADFFGLGESHKGQNQIGTKGFGTKIYYKSQRIKVQTWYKRKQIVAETEVPPGPSLQKGTLPTYRWDPGNIDGGKGTITTVFGFDAKQKEFSDATELQRYILWYTVAGSFGKYFGKERSIRVKLKTFDNPAPLTMDFGFSFPNEDLDLSQRTEDVCKIFNPKKIVCGSTEHGEITLQIIGAILGENKRAIIPDTYKQMGIWYCKDFIRIERDNDIIEEFAQGQYYYRNFLVLANSQSFGLTANRDDIQRNEEFDLIQEKIVEYFKEIWKDQFTTEYFKKKNTEEEDDRSVRQELTMQKRIEQYDRRKNLITQSVIKGPLKVPSNESETVILLQAMILSNHPAIDFRIGDYSSTIGQDFLIERMDRKINQKQWAEAVYEFGNLFKWDHNNDFLHVVICWRKGQVPNGIELNVLGKGRYRTDLDGKPVDVYVLSEILDDSPYAATQDSACSVSLVDYALLKPVLPTVHSLNKIEACCGSPMKMSVTSFARVVAISTFLFCLLKSMSIWTHSIQ
jgi:hypothetical protein